ncbi:MAG TPA: hypothetical protein VGV85_00550 [Longimicrobiaceae bacterium]|nr:hypothetical protein [Longimicrobiaceae bacterium]
MKEPPMSTGAEERFEGTRGVARLWYGVLAGAAAWKLQLVVNYAVVPYACWQRMEFINHAASFAMVLLALSGAWVAWGSWKATGASLDTDPGGTLGRSRFMALGGMALSGFLALIILGQWIPNLLLSPCDGIS